MNRDVAGLGGECKNESDGWETGGGDDSEKGTATEGEESKNQRSVSMPVSPPD